MAVIAHTGRRSGQPFTTPVRVFRGQQNFYVMVAPGRAPDWLRNLDAAGKASCASAAGPSPSGRRA